jgi:hypothetical protein
MFRWSPTLGYDVGSRQTGLPHNHPTLWTELRRARILFLASGCQRVALPATERDPLCHLPLTTPVVASRNARAGRQASSGQ